MKGKDRPDGAKKRKGFPFRGSHLFLLAVGAVYGGLFLFAPQDALRAVNTSGNVLVRLILPLSGAFTALFLTNLFVKPAHITRLLGKGAGLGGILLSTLAGIFSMGPIYTWYPLLEELRRQGASDFHIANFLSNRAVKPYLLPLMVFYFGWAYSLVLNVLIVIGAICIGWIVELMNRSHDPGGEKDGVLLRSNNQC